MIKIDLKSRVTLSLTCSYINSGVQFGNQSCDELSKSGLTELDKNRKNKSYDDSVKLKRTEMDPFRLG